MGKISVGTGLGALGLGEGGLVIDIDMEFIMLITISSRRRSSASPWSRGSPIAAEAASLFLMRVVEGERVSAPVAAP